MRHHDEIETVDASKAPRQQYAGALKDEKTSFAVENEDSFSAEKVFVFYRATVLSSRRAKSRIFAQC